MADLIPGNIYYTVEVDTDIHSFMKGHIYKAGARSQFFDTSEFKKILVVDDSIASGSAMIECKESLKHLSSKFDIK